MGGSVKSPEGLSIILSPVQLVAVLQGATVSPTETAANRLWGAVTLLGGAIELIGSAALLLTPDPTMVTKIGGWALAVHGSDTAATGLRQIWTGKHQITITAEAAAAAARNLGCDAATAGRIGMTVDILVPLVAASGAAAARVASIRNGTIDLMAEEAAGGHTIARHVGKTEAELRARLAAEPGIRAATSFRNLEEAEKYVSEALRANAAAIESWAKSTASTRDFIAVYSPGRPVGYGIVRSTQTARSMGNLTLVLRKTTNARKIYFVLTAYPRP